MRVLIALLAAAPLMGQMYADIYKNANKPSVPLIMPMDHMEQAMRIRLMQQQERMMAAQRESMANELVEKNFKEGFEQGLKKGFEDGTKATYQDFEKNQVAYGQTVLRNLFNLIFTADNPDQFRDLIAKFEPELAQDPGDQMKKALLLLYRARLTELAPPPPPKLLKKKQK